ncbi:MAG: serine hydrolase [bacterium]|nr:serine hydrolase [bacterium]
MMMRICSAVIIMFSALGVMAGVPDPLPWANPWNVGMDYEYVNRAFDEVTNAILDGEAPGAVGMIIKDGRIIARRAMGNLQTDSMSRSATGEVIYSPVHQRMIETAVFDLASMTKPVSTVTSIMILVEQGKIDLGAPVAQYIPSFAGRAKGEVTVRQLLTHTSGLPSWYMFYQTCVDRTDVYRTIDEDISLEYKPGDKRIYSDLGFITLGRLVEVVSGQRQDAFTRDHIFKPLGMNSTMYLPQLEDRIRVAPTEFDSMRGRELQGIVHDENTRVMGGVSGHAGLFSTANDLAIFAQMLLNKGEFNGVRILKPETIDLMLTSQITEEAQAAGSGFLRSRRQLLGWWGMDENATLNGLGGLPSKTAFGHQGFTGPIIWIDPEHKAAAMLLSNAVHPRREDAVKTDLYRAFFINVSKALVGPKNVTIQE